MIHKEFRYMRSDKHPAIGVGTRCVIYNEDKSLSGVEDRDGEHAGDLQCISGDSRTFLWL